MTDVATIGLTARVRALRQWRILLSLFFCLALAFAPSLAEARAGGSFSAGGGSSFGSRGLRSFENNGASPLSRSMAPTPPAASPLAGAYGGGSFFQRHPFLTGLFGGFLGSMLFHGHGRLWPCSRRAADAADHRRR